MHSLFTDQMLFAALDQRPFRLYPVVGSTNDIARDWALHGAPAGAIVIAEEQSHGRGRAGRTWVASPGEALMLSLILRPALQQSQHSRDQQPDPAALARLTMLGALSVAEALPDQVTEAGRVGIKWPNDVQIDGRKVCGVLPELTWDGEKLAAVVLGLGINVTPDFGDTDLAHKAISLRSAFGREPDRLKLLVRLLSRLDYWSARLTQPALFEAWRARLTTLGQQVTATSANGAITGQATDVDDHGGLLVQTENGTIRRVDSGEVTLSQP